MTFLPSMPQASLLTIFEAYPEFAHPIHEFAHTLMRGESPFSSAERELIAAYVSSLNGCDFCQQSHAATAERFGVSQDLLISLLQGGSDSSPISDKLKPVLRYVRVLNEAPNRVTWEIVEAIYEAGWDETAVCHAALICAFFNLMNRWVEGLGIEADDKVIQMAACQLHMQGYRGITQALGESGSSC